LPAAAVGTMFLVTKVVDAVSDPVMGLIADRTTTKWGKFRPYLLWGAIPYGVLGYAMFANPDLSDMGKLIYAYVTYTLMMLAYTAINVPYSALMGVISPSSVERTKVASYRFICAFAAAWLIGTFVTPLVLDHFRHDQRARHSDREEIEYSPGPARRARQWPMDRVIHRRDFHIDEYRGPQRFADVLLQVLRRRRRRADISYFR
jgi:MFS family permease